MPPGYISDEINEVGVPGVPGISGWISSTAYNGTRLLIQRATKETPELEAARLELASVVLGTCEWLLGFHQLEGSDSMTHLRDPSRSIWGLPESTFRNPI